MNFNMLRISDLNSPLDISIPLRFGGGQPNVYGVDPAKSKPCEYEDFVGDTRRGGSVNFEEYTLVPHCIGTHTECVGHITDERISVRECLKDVFCEAILITVKPENATLSEDSYPFEYQEDDSFFTKRIIENTLKKYNQDSPSTSHLSLIIRSLPNDESKLNKSYDKPVPPFFSNEAMRFIVESGFRHLLVDLPSIDRLYDDGKLSNHRIFWNVEADGRKATEKTRVHSTITELAYIPNDIKDGRYLLNLQIAPFETDAAPSRPVLFEISND